MIHDKVALFESVRDGKPSHVPQLLVLHRKYLVSDNEHCRLNRLTRVLRNLCQRLVEIQPASPELCHILLQFSHALIVETLLSGHCICDIKEAKNLSFQPTICSKKFLERRSRLPLELMEPKLVFIYNFNAHIHRRIRRLGNCSCLWCSYSGQAPIRGTCRLMTAKTLSMRAQGR